MLVSVKFYVVIRQLETKPNCWWEGTTSTIGMHMFVSGFFKVIYCIPGYDNTELMTSALDTMLVTDLTLKPSETKFLFFMLQCHTNAYRNCVSCHNLLLYVSSLGYCLIKYNFFT